MLGDAGTGIGTPFVVDRRVESRPDTLHVAPPDAITSPPQILSDVERLREPGRVNLDDVDGHTIPALCSSYEMVDCRGGRRPIKEVVVEPELVDEPIADDAKKFDRILAAPNLKVGSPVTEGACVVDEDDQRSCQAKHGK